MEMYLFFGTINFINYVYLYHIKRNLVPAIKNLLIKNYEIKLHWNYELNFISIFKLFTTKIILRLIWNNCWARLVKTLINTFCEYSNKQSVCIYIQPLLVQTMSDWDSLIAKITRSALLSRPQNERKEFAEHLPDGRGGRLNDKLLNKQSFSL